MNTISQTRSAIIHPARILLAASVVCAPGCSALSSGLFSGFRDGKSHVVEKVQTELSGKDRAQVCLQAGINFAAHKKDEHAIAQFRRARQFDPHLPGVAYPLAVLYDRQGSFSLAEREYKKALAEMGPDPDLLNDFGYFRYSQGHLEDAHRLLSEARQLEPRHSQAAINLAMVSAAQGDYETAFALFSDAVGTAAAHQNVGVLMLRAGRQQEAVAHLESAAALDPSLHTAAGVLAHYVPVPESSDTHSGSLAGYTDAGPVKQASWQVISDR